MGYNSVVLGNSKSIRILRVDGLLTGPPDLGHHSLVFYIQNFFKKFEQ